MSLLPHSSKDERIQLISKEETLNQLHVNLEAISNYSNQLVVTTCIVCHDFYYKSHKAIYTGKGLTCSPACSKKLRSLKHKEARRTESQETKDRRKAGLKAFYADGDKALLKLKKMKATNMERYGVENALQDSAIKEKAKKTHNQTIANNKDAIIAKRSETNLTRYGYENPFKNPEFQDTLKRHNLEKYGAEYYCQTDAFKAKARKSMLEKHGVANASQSEELMNKKKQTCLERYGFENPRQSPEIQKKIEDTCEKKYGTRNLLKDVDFRKRNQEQFRLKYGVDNPGQIKGHAEKAKSTMLDRYGVEHFKQLSSERNKLNEWCEENPGKMFQSKGEREVLDWLQTYYPNAKKYKKEGNEMDIFIPEINVGVEYNGLYRHSALFRDRRYHLNKTNYFESLNIRTIHIWEHEWKYRKHQVQSFILSAIGKNAFRLNPRQCKIFWSSDSEEIKAAHELLEDYHIQGATKSTKFVINAYYEDVLIATATFGKHHRQSNKWVLSRFCAKMNYTIRGLLGKITKMAYRELEQPIISWADLRLSQGNGYLKSGWILEDTLPPDYFYHKGLSVISKQSRQKKIVGTPDNITEIEHAKLDGLERVWDCGKMRFVYDPKSKGSKS